MTDIGKVAQQAHQGEVDEPTVIATARLIGRLTGIPVVQVIRSYKGWQAWAHGEAPVTSVLFGRRRKTDLLGAMPEADPRDSVGPSTGRIAWWAERWAGPLFAR